jgi:hypothetical protein
MKYIFLLAICTQFLAAQTFEVKRLKRIWWDGGGQIEITNDGITYKAKKPKNSRTWKYSDLQYFDRISNKEFVILSYEDVSWRFGRDREYHFVITSGELTDEVFRQISRRLNKPLTNRVVEKVSGVRYEIPVKPLTNRVVEKVSGVRYEIPVKHQHRLGGCEGVLKFTADAIYYSTDHKKDAREWLLARDVQSVWSMHPYELEVRVYDNNRREFSRTRVYKFDLKQRLDAEFYRSLKLKLYQLEIENSLVK